MFLTTYFCISQWLNGWSNPYLERWEWTKSVRPQWRPQKCSAVRPGNNPHSSSNALHLPFFPFQVQPKVHDDGIGLFFNVLLAAKYWRRGITLLTDYLINVRYPLKTRCRIWVRLLLHCVSLSLAHQMRHKKCSQISQITPVSVTAFRICMTCYRQKSTVCPGKFI